MACWSPSEVLDKRVEISVKSITINPLTFHSDESKLLVYSTKTFPSPWSFLQKLTAGNQSLYPKVRFGTLVSNYYYFWKISFL
jgi:hypothetical protein